MARVTHVKKAQQRYYTKPVIDPETGKQKQTPVMKRIKDRETGEITEVQKTTKKGRPVFLRISEPDKERPKEPYRCDFGGCKHPDRIIQVGDPYKHISPKSGPYGGRKLTRHADCPTWHQWEYSSSLGARLAEVSYNFSNDMANVESTEDVQAALEAAAEMVREIAGEKAESASNIEDGFGHPTSMSEDLQQQADDLESWADEIEQADIPEFPEPENSDCENCGGSGKEECTDHFHDEGNEVEDDETCDACGGTVDEPEEVDCSECDGSGETENDEPTDEQIDEWRNECIDSLTIVDESPV